MLTKKNGTVMVAVEVKGEKHYEYYNRTTIRFLGIVIYRNDSYIGREKALIQ